MQISFSTKLLRSMCENEDIATEEFGFKVSKKLKTRLADFRSIESVNDLKIWNFSELIHNNETSAKIDLVDDFQIIFRSNHIATPLGNDGKINWAQVSSIQITCIGNNNE